MLFAALLVCNVTPAQEAPTAGTDRPLRRPVVFSYNYPWGSDRNPNDAWTDPWFMDFGRVRLSTANMVDHVDVAKFREHWRTSARRILARTSVGSEDWSVERLVSSWDEALSADGIDGMAVDELIGNQATPQRMRTWVEALKETRRRHPRKVLAFWTDNGLGMVSKFGDAHQPLLMALRDYADYVMPEIYYRESSVPDFRDRDDPFPLFRRKAEEWEAAAPGITAKILMGLGTVQNADWGYDDRDDVDYGDFLARQVEVCATDPVLKQTAGLALYAPGYLKPATLTRVDDAIVEHYGINGGDEVGSELTDDHPPIDIGANRQLFVDDRLVANATNIQRVQGIPTKHPANPVIRRDKPWDQGRADLYGSAVYDPEHDRVQLFYAANNVFEGHEDRLAYAESYDAGDTWTKPELGLIPFGGAQNTNLVLLPPSQTMHGPCVFRDEHEADPAKRYKLFTASYPDTAYLGIPRIYEHRGAFLYAQEGAQVPEGCDLPGLFVAYSPDGIHWPTPPVRVSDMLSDTTQCAFWDGRIQRYVAYVRARTANDRSVARMESTDFETWTEPEVVLEGTPERCIYSMGVTQYEGLYIGTPWIFDQASEARGGPVIWPELAVSHDGKNWSRPFPGQPLIPTGPPGSADSRQIRMSASLVVLDDRILLLYGQTDRPHVTDMRVEIGAATLRLDGLAAMQAGDAEGTIRTSPLRFSSGRLRVNASVNPGGYVKAEVLRDGAAVPGYDLAHSRPVATDSQSAPLVWESEGRVPTTSEGDWRIRFALRDASLYSFWIEPL